MTNQKETQLLKEQKELLKEINIAQGYCLTPGQYRFHTKGLNERLEQIRKALNGGI